MAELKTFVLPSTVEGSDTDKALGQALIAAWQVDGIFQIQATPEQESVTGRALEASRDFFSRPLKDKARTYPTSPTADMSRPERRRRPGRRTARRYSPSAPTFRRTIPASKPHGRATAPPPGRRTGTPRP
ncbi:2-oxoglutarate and iron-dependent oxygenase domain-containing protein [Streptomyces capitiformicae]|nr:2-oxoglutarate and iron-dependent oxygenase domain-containing protein [Streptomyces capitiformicae]